jgi:hypothetical protein
MHVQTKINGWMGYFGEQPCVFIVERESSVSPPFDIMLVDFMGSFNE